MSHRDPDVSGATIGIIVGGRPGPGINGVIGAATMEALTDSYSYHVARAYMIRLEREDFASPASLAALGSEVHMTPHQFRKRYGAVRKKQREIQ